MSKLKEAFDNFRTLTKHLYYITNHYGKASDYLRRFPNQDLVIIQKDKDFRVVDRAYAEANKMEVLDV